MSHKQNQFINTYEGTGLLPGIFTEVMTVILQQYLLLARQYFHLGFLQ